MLSSVHQCLLIKIFDIYFDNQSFRSKRSLISGVSFRLDKFNQIIKEDSTLEEVKEKGWL